jgi:transposase
MMVDDELTLLLLRAENRQLRQQLALASEQLAEAKQSIAKLEQRIAELEGQRKDPHFAKSNRPKSQEPKKPRRKRDPHHNHARRVETPTRTTRHALEHCPECNYTLRGESVDYARQVIELPPPQPVEVIEHRVIKRYCPKCQSWQSPKLDLSGQVFGQGRMGTRLASLIAYLRTTMRLPIRRIKAYLEAVHMLTISSGEIVEILHQVRRHTTEAVAKLKEEAQSSKILHADETGWRENGRNGYIWSFSTPGEAGVRYYEYDPSRSHKVVKRVLEDKFKGHLVSDFYAGYNDYGCKKQRCWTHLLGDLHELKEKHPEEAGVVEWAKSVRVLYDEAEKWLKTARGPTREEREREYVRLVGEIHQLGLPYAQMKGHPCQALSKRILRHEDELFQFVLVEGLSANNNLAERSIRPMVVIRKISGGTRSVQGSKTRMALGSLFETWHARGLNPFVECVNLLTRQPVPSL